MIERLSGTALLAVLLLFTAACSQTPEFPPDAEAALRGYWESLPAESSLAHAIIRAWPGDLSGEDAPPGMQAWCVEAEVSSPDPELDGERLLWIVVRTGEAGPWTAALLATMSSTWPYEACGQSLNSQFAAIPEA